MFKPPNVEECQFQLTWNHTNEMIFDYDTLNRLRIEIYCFLKMKIDGTHFLLIKFRLFLYFHQKVLYIRDLCCRKWTPCFRRFRLCWENLKYWTTILRHFWLEPTQNSWHYCFTVTGIPSIAYWFSVWKFNCVAVVVFVFNQSTAFARFIGAQIWIVNEESRIYARFGVESPNNFSILLAGEHIHTHIRESLFCAIFLFGWYFPFTVSLFLRSHASRFRLVFITINVFIISQYAVREQSHKII